MASRTGSKEPMHSEVTSYLLFLMAVTTLGPFQFGFHLAELNAPQDVMTCTINSLTKNDSRIPNCISMTSAQFSVVNAIYTLGGLIGALSSGPLSTHRGRLLTMRITTIFFITGPLLSSLAPSITVMALGRVISGIGAGAALVVVPIYIAEVAPPKSKGLFGALTQITVNTGILIAQLLGYFLSYGNMWRIVLAVAGMIGLVQCVGLFFIPESPQWLVSKGRTKLAKTVLTRIRGDKNIESEVENDGTASEGEEETEALLGEEGNPANPSNKKPSDFALGIIDVVRHPDHYKAIIAVVAVMLAQQLCGINSIVMYSVSTLKTIIPTTARLITVAVGALNLIATIAFSPLSDRLGRKVCLLMSIAGMGINAVLLGGGILYGVKALSVIATLLFVASFALGLGPVPFTLANELVGPEAVGAVQSWALASNWIATFLVAQFFPILDTALGENGKVYFVFAGLGAVFFAFVAWWVPETRGKKDADEVWGRERRED